MKDRKAICLPVQDFYHIPFSVYAWQEKKEKQAAKIIKVKILLMPKLGGC